jgi:hypothetical protein
MKMKPADTLADRKRWVEQWRQTGIFLDEVKRDELANMTDEECWSTIESLQSTSNAWRDPAAICGLIEQQALFARLPK